MFGPSSSVAAILLTGGSSRRMGHDKALVIVDGSTLAVRTASLLQLVVETAIEVGPGVSGLPATCEEPQGDGPLVAIAEGCRALRANGHTGGALVVACDLPLLTERLLRFLVEWGSPGSVVPMVRGRAQPLLARWSGDDLDGARQLVNEGVRSLQLLVTQPHVALLDESTWPDVVTDDQFSDVDSPDDLRRLGLTS
ncbi:MAG TPA: molybdenum cofactor guanylyltransferase [Acidimicrobiales bacterium]|nr:molybdenum cofactor guanylyltransferase [Acidimicrobiales bacterium]